jgi:hypothetical protein
MDQWWHDERATPDDGTAKSAVFVDVTPPRQGDYDEISAHDDRPLYRGRSLWRRVAEPLLLLATVATVLAITKPGQDESPPGPDHAPAPVASGSHRMELYGSVPGGQTGVLCGDQPEHQKRLAEAEIIVILLPRRPDRRPRARRPAGTCPARTR